MQGEIGTEVARFRIDSEIGRGGMGVVYLAEQDSPRRKVALKILTPQLANDPSFRERFRRESEAAASIEHPSVVPIYGAGESDGQLYLAMRYVEGTDLGTLIAREGPLAPERAARICTQIAEALAAAHRRGVVHRDVKPGNVLLDADDHAYLSDFGLVRQTHIGTGITKTGQLTGTIDYVAPEQIRGDQVDGRADVYSLGCVLFECLVGEPPFRRDTEVATLYAHLESPTPRPSERRPGIPLALDEVVTEATAKSADERFASAHDLASALSVGMGGPPPSLHRPERRRAIVGWVVAALAVVAVGVAVAITLSDGEAGPASSPDEVITPEQNTVLAIDTETGEFVRSVSVGDRPDWIVVQGVTAWIANEGEGTVSWVDLRGGRTRTIPVPISGDLFVVSDGVNGVWAYGQRTRTIAHISASKLKVDQTLQIPERPFAIIFLPDGSAWETAGWYQQSYAIEFDPETGREVARVEVGLGPVSIQAGFGSLWVLAHNEQSLDRISLSTREVVASIPTSAAPYGLLVDQLDVWVGTITASSLFRVDQIGVGRGTVCMAVDEQHLWLANQTSGTIDVIDKDQAEVVDTIELGVSPSCLALDENGVLWVTLRGIEYYVP